MKTNCKNCNKEIETTLNRIKSGRGKFCSKKCSSSYNSKGKKNSMYGKKHKEDTVNKIKEKRKLQKNNNIGKHWKIAQEKCKNMVRVGIWDKEKNPSWIDGRARELGYPVDWKKSLRRSIRERDKYTCQVCKESQGDEALSIHHIDYNKENCNPNNLVTLCRGCHTKTNFNRKSWILFFNL